MDRLAFRVTAAERRQDMASAFRFGLAREFFQGFANEARCNLHLELLYGDEPHHVVEALFKAFAKAVDFACQHDPRIAGRCRAARGGCEGVNSAPGPARRNHVESPRILRHRR